jgi:hypothetical protein
VRVSVSRIFVQQELELVRFKRKTPKDQDGCPETGRVPKWCLAINSEIELGDMGHGMKRAANDRDNRRLLVEASCSSRR